MTTTARWICPNCGYQNFDVKDYTAAPFCGNCDTNFTWEEIFAMEDTDVETEEETDE